jgi:hypothetical protein
MRSTTHGLTTLSRRELEDLASKILKANGFNADGQTSPGKGGGNQYAFERRMCKCPTNRMNRRLRNGR